MKNYRLVPKNPSDHYHISYNVETFEKTVGKRDFCFITVQYKNEQPFHLGSEIEENNRGWKIETMQLTGKFITLFLDRSLWLKIETKEK